MKKTSAPRYSVFDRLVVEVHPDRAALGRAAARAAALYLRDVISRQGEARVIFACAPSQNEFLATLADSKASGVALDWSRVTAFHMDDYIGLRADQPQSFRYYLQKHFLDHVKVGRFHPLPADEPDIARVCARYAALLVEKPIDLICMGTGENGHIAFNDPPVCDFQDHEWVKAVEIDDTTRQQQVNDKFFDRIEDVPRRALTITAPVFRHARRLSVHVPNIRKAAGVRQTLREPISEAYPGTILRTHPDATLYLDEDSASVAKI